MSNSQQPLLILHPKYFRLELRVRDLPQTTRLHCLGACAPKVTRCVLAGLKLISHLLPNSLQIGAGRGESEIEKLVYMV